MAYSYTSLRDLMAEPNPNNASWNEIPIKDPLLKHAALAYLQPMSTALEVNSNLKLKGKCFCDGRELGCFEWLSSRDGSGGGGDGCILKRMWETFVEFFAFFCERRRIGNNEKEEEEEKVD